MVPGGRKRAPGQSSVRAACSWPRSEEEGRGFEGRPAGRGGHGPRRGTRLPWTRWPAPARCRPPSPPRGRPAPAAGRVGGRLVQVLVVAAAADDVDPGDGLAGQMLDRGDHRRVAQGQRIEDHPRQSGRLVGRGLARLAQRGAHRSQHARRVQEAEIVGNTMPLGSRSAAAACISSAWSSPTPSRSHSRRQDSRIQRPITFFRNRTVPNAPISLVKLARATGSPRGLLPLDANQRPGARGDVGPPGSSGVPTTALRCRGWPGR